jgi:transposase
VETGCPLKRPKPRSSPDAYLDLRKWAVVSVDERALSRREVAKQFDVGVSTVINSVRRYRETGSVAPGEIGGYKPKAIRGEHETGCEARPRERRSERAACGGHRESR